MEAPLSARSDGSGAPQPIPAPKINHRREAEDWVLSPEVAAKLTPSEHKVLMVLARRCNRKVGFEPQPVLYSFCDLRKRKTYTGILNQLGISHEAYLQHVSRIQRKGLLFKSSETGTHGHSTRHKDITKRRVTYTRWRLPVPLLASAKQEPLFRTEHGTPELSDMTDSHVTTGSDMTDSHVATGSDMTDSHVATDRPLLDISTTRDKSATEPPPISYTRARAHAREGGGEGGGLFCSDFLIPAFENVGLTGFTAYALAHIEPAAARFAETHGESSWPDVAVYIAERVAKFIEQYGIDVAEEPHRILSTKGGYLRSPELLSVFDGMSLRFKRPEPEPREPMPEATSQSEPAFRQHVSAEDWQTIHSAHSAPRLTGRSRTQHPAQTWDAALGELQLNVARPAFETWLRDTDGLADGNGDFVVGAANAFVAEMLEHRMYPLIERAIEKVTGEPLSVRFVVASSGDGCPLCREEE